MEDGGSDEEEGVVVGPNQRLRYPEAPSIFLSSLDPDLTLRTITKSASP